jgi:hypothetical protein
MYIFQPLFCNLHSSIKQWTDFPQRNISYPKKPNEPSPMICFASPFASYYPGLSKNSLHQPALLPIYIYLFLSLRLCYCFTLPYPGTMCMSQVPILMFFFFLFLLLTSDAPHIISTLPCLVLSCMAGCMVVLVRVNP